MLSIEEVVNYFDVHLNGYYTGESLIIEGTPYAINRGTWTRTITQEYYQDYVKSWESYYSEKCIGSIGCNWSLRSPGYGQNQNLVVGGDGFVFGSATCEVNSTLNGIRPAIWVMY